MNQLDDFVCNWHWEELDGESPEPEDWSDWMDEEYEDAA